FLHCIQMDTSVNAANQVVSVGADIAFDADPKFFACLVRFESSSVPTTLPTAYDVYPLDGRDDGDRNSVQHESPDRSRMPCFSCYSFALSLPSFPTRRSYDLFFIAFRWIHLSTPLIRLFLLVLILLLMPTLNFLPVWFALSLLRFRLPSRLPMMFILWMVAMM